MSSPARTIYLKLDGTKKNIKNAIKCRFLFSAKKATVSFGEEYECSQNRLIYLYKKIAVDM